MSIPGYQPLDRRPIAARRLAIFSRASRTLVRAGVSANQISIAGMLAAMLAGACFAFAAPDTLTGRVFWLAGGVLVQLRLIANLLDGMVAIESGKASPIGELYNEVPDRVSDTAVLIGLGVAAGGPPWLGAAAALAAVLTAYVRAMGKAAGAPSDFCGPLAKQQRMFVVTVVAVFCAVVPHAWRSAVVGSRTMSVAEAALWIILFGSLLTAWRRLLRIAAALRAKAE